jgi:hypothetical protein
MEDAAVAIAAIRRGQEERQAAPSRPVTQW